MAVETVEIAHECTLEACTWEDIPTSVELTYTESAGCIGCGRHETTVIISREKAAEMVAFLQKHFEFE